MPLMLPKQRGVLRVANYSGQPATTWGTSLTSDGTTNVEPATETELISAANNTVDSDWVNVWFHTNNSSATDTDSLVNIKVGTAGNEITVIPNLLAGWVTTPSTGLASPRQYGFPLRIPSGTRISATHRSVRVSATVRCMIELLGGGQGMHWTGTQVEAVGADTANSSGTYITPGAASEGTFTSLGTTTNEWGYVQPMLGGNTDTTMNGGQLTCDLGTGVGAPIPGLDEFWFHPDSNETSVNHGLGRYCHVPAGTTLYLRAQTSAAAEAMAFVAYGCY